MEMFGLSKRELEEKFTRSEMVLLAWRSQEVSAKLEQTTAGMNSGKNFNSNAPQGLPKHFYNEEGEVDLRQVTGAEAYRYFSSRGVRLPIMSGKRGGDK
jgi:hypothetical protein